MGVEELAEDRKCAYGAIIEDLRGLYPLILIFSQVVAVLCASDVRFS